VYFEKIEINFHSAQVFEDYKFACSLNIISLFKTR